MRLSAESPNGSSENIRAAVLSGGPEPASVIAGFLYDKVDNKAPFYFGSAMALTAAVLMLGFVLLKKPGLSKGRAGRGYFLWNQEQFIWPVWLWDFPGL